MIITTDIDVINEVDSYFTIAERRYEELFLSQNTAECFDLRDKWQNTPFTSPLLDVSTCLVKLYKTPIFKREINHHLYQGNNSYFQYVSNVIKKRVNFITLFIKNAVSFYFNNTDRSTELIKKLYNGEPLTSSNIKLAVELDFIEKVELFETVYRKYDANYECVLVANNYPAVANTGKAPIILNYADAKKEGIIIDLHKLFFNKYIDDDFEAFYAHFKVQNSELPKIKWKENLILLCAIFFGADLTDANLTRVPPISITIPNLIPQIICDHFCDKDGNNINVASINTFKGRLALRRNTNGIQPFIQTLKNINSNGY